MIMSSLGCLFQPFLPPNDSFGLGSFLGHISCEPTDRHSPHTPHKLRPRARKENLGQRRRRGSGMSDSRRVGLGQSALSPSSRVDIVFLGQSKRPLILPTNMPSKGEILQRKATVQGGSIIVDSEPRSLPWRIQYLHARGEGAGAADACCGRRLKA